MPPEITPEELARAMDQCAERTLWEACIRRPPVDAFYLAKQLGIVVAQDELLGHRASYVRPAGFGGGEPGTILLGAEPRPERRQWAVAHELGEFLAHQVFEALSIQPDFSTQRARESVANQLATRLLLPRHWFAADGPATGWDLLELKQVYRSASHELIAGRMLEMSPPVVVTVCDRGRVSWRRGNLPGQPPSLTGDEWNVWQSVHVTGQPHELYLDGSGCGLCNVRCWPVHEPGWRREILRAEVCDLD